MSKQLFTLLGIFFVCSSFAQTGYSKQYNFINYGENAGDAVPYMDGLLLTSTQYGNATVEHTIRKIDGNDSVERNIRFNNNFQHYFHPVVTTSNTIFVFGVQSYITATEVNYLIMDSNFNVLQEKKLVVPYSIVFCKFYKAKDGGVIGVVQELCDESRIFRLDAQGNLLWIKSYVGFLSTGLYDRTIINSIFLTPSDRYLITGHLGFGYGLFFVTIEDDGTLIRSNVVGAFPTGSHSDAMWHSAFDGEKAICIVDNATNGRDTTYIIELDTTLTILNMNRIIYTDSTAQSRSCFATPTEFIVGSTIALYPPFAQTEMIITGFDKTTLQVNWTFTTNGNNTADFGFYCFAGMLGADGRPVFVYNAGPMNLTNNGGNNYDYWTMVKLDTVQQLGFCDKLPTTTLSVPVPWDTTQYWIDTIAHPYCYVIAATHPVSYIANGVPEPECSFTVGVEEIVGRDIRMFPNPVSGILYFDGIYFSEVTDVNGKVVSANTRSSSLDLSGVASGIYFVTLRDENGTAVARKKLVKE